MKPTALKKSEAKRLRILNTSTRLILHKGFAGVGLQEILHSCDIPKGSFYHYFQSKESFGCELIQYYVDNYQAQLNTLWDTEESAYDKLTGYFKLWIQGPEPNDGLADSCLIVKLAAEVSDLSEDIRIIMSAGVDLLVQRIADLITIGKQDQSIPTSDDAATLAQVIYQMWVGAALLSKLQKNKAPLYQALNTTEFLLKQTKN
ncbi:TetR/AcrR family transcriptional regulator [Acinetobacter johnsonii]|uniref:TetR/AcrR family transcriptional regulator n=1 Tax=Acinetobacter johnsonii TaxID=40214 RepID=UPI0021678891|nr:TetR/AcrR family transcriptional regulator [Acinetobacter johnsonii]MCS3527064.1 TetR/AcrR family transcriptional repressor of nem operon [Acinetobacter johnsonii]